MKNFILFLLLCGFALTSNAQTTDYVNNTTNQQDKLRCPDCNGIGRIVYQRRMCSLCNATGGTTCTFCRGSGIRQFSANGQITTNVCGSCGGTGSRACSSCSGSGVAREEESFPCSRCKKTGYIEK